MAIDTIRPGGVLNIVNALRRDGMTASFCFGTDQIPLSGKQCLVYAVNFPDGDTWAIRIPVYISSLPSEAITSTVEAEASILQRLQKGGFAWSPKLVGYCSGFNNPIAYPYIVLTWIHGTPLRWAENIPPCGESRDKLLSQISHILVELAECSQVHGTLADAVTYLTDIIDRKILRVLSDQLPGIDPQSCLLQRALIRMAFYAAAEPMLVSHEDLVPSNIIVDHEYNIKGIIDWGFARILPLQLAVGLPRFLAIEPSLDESPQSDVAKLSSTLLQPAPTLYQDRQCLISHISSLAEEGDSQTTSFRRLVLSVFLDANLDWRRLLFESVSSKGMHRWMADRKWLLPGMKNIPAGLERPLQDIIASERDEFLTRMAELGVNLEQPLL